jgi:hypothetical protein
MRTSRQQKACPSKWKDLSRMPHHGVEDVQGAWCARHCAHHDKPGFVPPDNLPDQAATSKDGTATWDFLPYPSHYIARHTRLNRTIEESRGSESGAHVERYIRIPL